MKNYNVCVWLGNWRKTDNFHQVCNRKEEKKATVAPKRYWLRYLYQKQESKFSFLFWMSVLFLHSGTKWVNSHFSSFEIKKNWKIVFIFIKDNLFCWNSGLARSENLSDSAALTIFYNGTVSIFDVPWDKVCFVLNNFGINKASKLAS